jgi:hypothetical protein
MRSTAVFLGVAAMGYLAGAFMTGSLPPSESAAFARPAQAAEGDSRPALPAITPLAPVRGADQSDAEWSETPRECDVTRGISTACVFMD